MGGFNEHIGRRRDPAFMLEDQPDRVAQSLPPKVGVSAAAHVGAHQEQRGAFHHLGGAAAQTRNPRSDYGGSDGVTGDSLLAEYDAATSEVWLLDNLQTRNSRTNPWKVGLNIQLLADPNKSAKGIVVRGSQLGDRGFDAHVFIAAPAQPLPPVFTPGPTPVVPPIILHHFGANAPQNSTIAYDPDFGARRAPLSDALRIVGGVKEACQGKTVATPIGGGPRIGPNGGPGQNIQRGDDWVVLNATKHGGNRFSGFLAMKFQNLRVGYGSYEQGGPIIPATELHDMNEAWDGHFIRPAAIYADALITRGSKFFDAPAEVLDVDEPQVKDPEGHPVRVWFMHDRRVTHGFPCGTRPGLRRWHTKVIEVELPPCEGQPPYQGEPPENIVPVQRFGYYAGRRTGGGFSGLSHPGA